MQASRAIFLAERQYERKDGLPGRVYDGVKWNVQIGEGFLGTLFEFSPFVNINATYLKQSEVTENEVDLACPSIVGDIVLRTDYE